MAAVAAEEYGEIYRSKAAEPLLAPLVAAASEGDVAKLRAAWRPALRPLVERLARDDTSHPLLHAAHRLQADCVRFLVEECGLSPRQRASAHPYTGDSLTVGEMQGVTPLECVSKMIVLHSTRKSKRRDQLMVRSERASERERERDRQRAARARARTGVGVCARAPDERAPQRAARACTR